MKRIKTFITLKDYKKEEKIGYIMDFDTSLFIYKSRSDTYTLTDIATGARIYDYTTSSYKKAMELCRVHYCEHDLGDAIRYFKGTAGYDKLLKRVQGTCL